jgi:sterol-4alpha-carboxylate 3-dehydrogenase (decarboxylating)
VLFVRIDADRSKACAEKIVLSASGESIKTCALRPSVICGEGDNQLLPSIHECIAKRETPYIIGDGNNLWDVTYVGNVADAHVLAAENLLSSKTAAGEAFFIQNNEPIAFRDLSLAIWKHFGHLPPFQIVIPAGLAWCAGFLAEWLTWMSGTRTTLTRGSVKDACSVRYASGLKAARILGYRPRIGIEEGIRISCEVCLILGAPEMAHRMRLKSAGLCKTTQASGERLGLQKAAHFGLPWSTLVYSDSGIILGSWNQSVTCVTEIRCCPCPPM